MCIHVDSNNPPLAKKEDILVQQCISLLKSKGLEENKINQILSKWDFEDYSGSRLILDLDGHSEESSNAKDGYCEMPDEYQQYFKNMKS